MSDSMKIVGAVREAANFLQKMAVSPSYYPESDLQQAGGIANRLRELRQGCGSRMSFVDELCKFLDGKAYSQREASALMDRRIRKAFSECFPPTRA